MNARVPAPPARAQPPDPVRPHPSPPPRPPPPRTPRWKERRRPELEPQAEADEPALPICVGLGIAGSEEEDKRLAGGLALSGLRSHFLRGLAARLRRQPRPRRRTRRRRGRRGFSWSPSAARSSWTGPSWSAAARPPHRPALAPVTPLLWIRLSIGDRPARATGGGSTSQPPHDRDAGELRRFAPTRPPRGEAPQAAAPRSGRCCSATVGRRALPQCHGGASLSAGVPAGFMGLDTVDVLPSVVAGAAEDGLLDPFVYAPNAVGAVAEEPALAAASNTAFSRMFYGPGGPYASGRDASRALAKMSFEPSDLTSDISGLGPFAIEALQEREYKFKSKYVTVGIIKKTVLPEICYSWNNPSDFTVGIIKKTVPVTKGGTPYITRNTVTIEREIDASILKTGATNQGSVVKKTAEMSDVDVNTSKPCKHKQP